MNRVNQRHHLKCVPDFKVAVDPIAMLRGWRLAWMLAAAAFLALTFAPAVVLAQADDIKKGDSAASSGNWEEAYVAYDKAHKAAPTAETSRKRANALYKLKRTVDAFEAYEQLLRDHGKDLARGDKDTALKRRDELRDKVGAIKVNVSETGAQITLDGKVVGKSPLPAPLNVLVGKHKLEIEKPGFQAFSQEVDVAAKATVSVDASLKAVSDGGTVNVKVRGGEALTVVIDGKEMGPAPFTGKLAPGTHEISGRSQTLSAPVVTVEVKTGETAQVELVAGPAGGTFEVRIDGGKGEIFIDGKKVGSDTFKGEVAPGEHTLVVKRDGYEDYEKTVNIKSGETLSESVTLRKAAAGEVDEGDEDWREEDWTFDGIYGGLQFIGMFQPAGSGSSMDLNCDVLGATTCDAGTPMGGGFGLYIGYAFAPVGLELLAVGSGDVTSPLVTYDGTTSSTINPLVSTPARDEEFIVGRFGGGGAVRLRLLYPIDRFRITGAIGAGLVYRQLLMGREGRTPDGYESSHTPDGVDYLSGVLSIELGGQVRLGGTTSLALGFNLWLEHAGDGVTTEGDESKVLAKDGAVPPALPHATPGYDLASGTQLMIGPFLGLQFGP